MENKPTFKPGDRIKSIVSGRCGTVKFIRDSLIYWEPDIIIDEYLEMIPMIISYNSQINLIISSENEKKTD